MEMETIRTTILRQTIDNLYWQNMPQPITREGAVVNPDAVLAPTFGKPIRIAEDVQDVRRKAGEMSVLIHSPTDVVELKPPSPADYEAWVAAFLDEAAHRLGAKVTILSNPQLRERVAAILRERFEETPDSERILRNWTKLAGFPPAILMAQPRPLGVEEIPVLVDDAARQVANGILPWEEEPSDD